MSQMVTQDVLGANVPSGVTMKFIICAILSMLSLFATAKEICYQDGDIRCYSEEAVDNLDIFTDYVATAESIGVHYRITETEERVTIEILGEDE